MSSPLASDVPIDVDTDLLSGCIDVEHTILSAAHLAACAVFHVLSLVASTAGRY